jgi:hypothetical protein
MRYRNACPAPYPNLHVEPIPHCTISSHILINPSTARLRRLGLLRIHNAILLNLRLMIRIHRRHELEDGRRANARKALDDVCNRTSAFAIALRIIYRLLTVLVRDGALCVSDSLLRRLDDAVGRVVGPAHDDGSLGYCGHGEGGEERNEEGGQDKAHVCRGVRGDGRVLEFSLMTDGGGFGCD